MLRRPGGGWSREWDGCHGSESGSRSGARHRGCSTGVGAPDGSRRHRRHRPRRRGSDAPHLSFDRHQRRDRHRRRRGRGQAASCRSAPGSATAPAPSSTSRSTRSKGAAICATGGYNALSIVAIAERDGFLRCPDMYMEKIAVGPEARGLIKLERSPTDNLRTHRRGARRLRRRPDRRHPRPAAAREADRGGAPGRGARAAAARRRRRRGAWPPPTPSRASTC